MAARETNEHCVGRIKHLQETTRNTTRRQSLLKFRTAWTEDSAEVAVGM